MEGQRKIIYGTETLEQITSFSGLDSDFTHVQSVRVGKSRALGEKIFIDEQEGDVVEMIFDDGTHWIGNASDIDEIYGRNNPVNRAAGNEFEFAANLSAPGTASRGGGKGGILKIFNLFRPKKKVAKKAAKELAILVDRKFSEQERLVSVSESFVLTPIETMPESDDSYLVLLHGTISNTEQSFEGLAHHGDKPWSKIHEDYGGRVVAWDHFTLSKSVLDNALELLKKIPDGARIDLMSGSRGGLIADILARCDRRNETVGFSVDEIRRMEKKFEEKEEAAVMKEISDLAISKGIEVGKVIRVACPGSGTSLLSRRIDHFLNALLSSIGFAFGAGANPIFQTVRSLLLEIVRQRYNTDAMPGLWSMVPSSPFQQILNSPESKASSELFVIEGDARFGGKIGYSLLVILTNLFYRKDNDFVIETYRMRHGASRTQGVFLFNSNDNTTHHLNYFKKKNSQEAIVQAITSESRDRYEHLFVGQDDRGVALSLIDFKSFNVDNVSGHRPVTVLLPGIMGSFIYSDDDLIWVNLREIHKGRLIDDLHYGAQKVEARAVIARYYQKLAEHLQKTHDVVTVPFDWRLSLDGAAEKLGKVLEKVSQHNVPIRVLAHSMGGLVVRQFMMDNADTWKGYMDRKDSRFIMLGTPWLGSYLILQVLTGHSKKVKLLSFLDKEHKKIELLEMLSEYRGVFQLLPIEDRDDRKFETLKFWRDLQKEGDVTMHIPSKDILDQFATYKRRVQKEVGDLPMDKVIYVAGKSKSTVCDFEIKNRYFRDDIVYLATPQGDGSVTWASGIPEGIKPENLYFARTNHTQLSNDEKIFKGITELLESGTTRSLPRVKPADRSGEEIIELYEEFEPVFDAEAAIDAFYDADSPVMIDYDDVGQLKVSVTNAHLQMARYPLLVGHFRGDGIVSAEGVIDRNLDYKLSQMHYLGDYPGDVGESRIFLKPDARPRGAIIAGLGVTGELTTFNLKVTVERAVLNYMLEVRDNVSDPDHDDMVTGISVLLVGSGFGSLTINESVRGILLGITAANMRISQFENDLSPIENVEILEYYEEKAASAYKYLRNSRHLDKRVSYQLANGIETKYGAKKQQVTADDGSWWWHSFVTKGILDECDECSNKVKGLEFHSSSGIARVERQTIMIPGKQIEILFEQLADSDSWRPEMAKTLFELLVPNDFKEILRSQHNVVWRMDNHVAQWPWELLYDITTDVEPSSINSGLIRRLVVDDYREIPYRAPERTALVVGDPVYNIPELTPLEGAKQEAEKVYRILNNSGFDCRQEIRTGTVEILTALYASEYRILHFSGHGVYDPDGMGIGIALGNGELLTAAHIKQLPYVPDFVFVNCCLSGKIEQADQAYYMNRYKLAANVGTQLIMNGVRAVVVTGWEVSDAGALKFAETFYNAMWRGVQFGDAVTQARKACFQQDGTSSTWAAYQCYGDQFYQFTKGGFDEQLGLPYVLKAELLRDLDNLYSDAATSDGDLGKNDQLYDLLTDYLARAGELVDGEIFEMKAMICAELGRLEESVNAYEEMLQYEYAGYSVKAVEQYCNVRQKLILRKYDRGEITAKTAASLYAHVISDLKSLIALGETAEKYALLGSAYKHSARLYDSNSMADQLKLSLDQYALAYERDQSRGGDNWFYYATNHVSIAYLLYRNTRAFESAVKKLTGMSSKDYLKHMNSVARSRSSGSDRYYDRLSLINVKLVEMLIGAESGLTKARKEIVELYKDAFELTGSSKKRKTETDQLDCLIATNRLSEAKQKALEKLKEEIEKL